MHFINIKIFLVLMCLQQVYYTSYELKTVILFDNVTDKYKANSLNERSFVYKI